MNKRLVLLESRAQVLGRDWETESLNLQKKVSQSFERAHEELKILEKKFLTEIKESEKQQAQFLEIQYFSPIQEIFLMNKAKKEEDQKKFTEEDVDAFVTDRETVDARLCEPLRFLEWNECIQVSIGYLRRRSILSQVQLKFVEFKVEKQRTQVYEGQAFSLKLYIHFHCPSQSWGSVGDVWDRISFDVPMQQIGEGQGFAGILQIQTITPITPLIRDPFCHSIVIKSISREKKKKKLKKSPYFYLTLKIFSPVLRDLATPRFELPCLDLQYLGYLTTENAPKYAWKTKAGWLFYGLHSSTWHILRDGHLPKEFPDSETGQASEVALKCNLKGEIILIIRLHSSLTLDFFTCYNTVLGKAHHHVHPRPDSLLKSIFIMGKFLYFIEVEEEAKSGESRKFGLKRYEIKTWKEKKLHPRLNQGETETPWKQFVFVSPNFYFLDEKGSISVISEKGVFVKTYIVGAQKLAVFQRGVFYHSKTHWNLLENEYLKLEEKETQIFHDIIAFQGSHIFC